MEKRVTFNKISLEVINAIEKVAVLHVDQVRKGGGLPYVSHPCSVAYILSCFTRDENIVIAGLLHDVLEDVKYYGFEKMKKDFGEKVANIVKEVSEDKDPNVESDPKANWIQRKNSYLKNMETDSFEALMVCCADKIHNLISVIEGYQTQGEEYWDNFNAPKDLDKLWFYGEVLKILKQRLQNPIVLELEKTYKKARKVIK